MEDLMKGTRATGANAFEAGRPTFVPSTQIADESASVPYEAVLDPKILEISSQMVASLSKQKDPKESQVSLI
jgi:hypothetical protein